MQQKDECMIIYIWEHSYAKVMNKMSGNNFTKCTTQIIGVKQTTQIYSLLLQHTGQPYFKEQKMLFKKTKTTD